MKYLKRFELVENDLLPGLKSCFEGFEELDWYIRQIDFKSERGLHGLNMETAIEISTKSKGIGINSEKIINDDFIDELESSVGKAKDLGFKFLKGNVYGNYIHSSFKLRNIEYLLDKKVSMIVLNYEL